MIFPGEANYLWLNGDYPVIIMSTTHHARVMRLEAFVIAWTTRDTFYRLSKKPFVGFNMARDLFAARLGASRPKEARSARLEIDL